MGSNLAGGQGDIAADHNDHDMFSELSAYELDHLCHHLARAERGSQLLELLRDPLWMDARLRKSSVDALLSDFAIATSASPAVCGCGDGEDIGLSNVAAISGCLHRAKDALRSSPSQLRSQLAGRLPADMSGRSEFLERLARTSDRPWLRPLCPTLHGPQARLLRSIPLGHVTPGSNWAEVRQLAADDAGRMIGIVSNTAVYLHDLRTSTSVQVPTGGPADLPVLHLSPSGRVAVLCRRAGVEVRDATSGALIRHIEDDGRCRKGVARVTSDAELLFAGDRPHALLRCDLRSGETHPVCDLPPKPVNALSVQGGIAAVLSGGSSVSLVDLSSGRLSSRISTSLTASSLQLSPDARFCTVVVTGGTVERWDVSQGRRVSSTRLEWDSASKRPGLNQCGGAGVPVRSVLPGGHHFVTQSGFADHILEVWEVSTGVRLVDGSLRGAAFVAQVASAPGNELVFTVEASGVLRVWDVSATPNPFASAEPGDPRGAPDDVQGCHILIPAASAQAAGHEVWAISDVNVLTRWDVRTGRLLSSTPGPPSGVRAAGVSADGRIAACALFRRDVAVWDLTTGQCRGLLRGHLDDVDAVAVSADGRIVASGGWDERVCAWDANTGRQVWSGRWRTKSASEQGIAQIVLTGDARVVFALAHDGGIGFCDLARDSDLQMWKWPPLGHPALGVPTTIGAASTENEECAFCLTTSGHVCVIAPLDGSLDVVGHHPGKPAVMRTYPKLGAAVTASEDGRTVIWDLGRRTARAQLDPDGFPVEDAGLSEDGRYLVRVGREGTFEMRRVADGSFVASFAPDGPIAAHCSLGSGSTIALAETSGRMHFLTLQG